MLREVCIVNGPSSEELFETLRLGVSHGKKVKFGILIGTKLKEVMAPIHGIKVGKNREAEEWDIITTIPQNVVLYDYKGYDRGGYEVKGVYSSLTQKGTLKIKVSIGEMTYYEKLSDLSTAQLVNLDDRHLHPLEQSRPVSPNHKKVLTKSQCTTYIQVLTERLPQLRFDQKWKVTQLIFTLKTALKIMSVQ